MWLLRRNLALSSEIPDRRTNLALFYDARSSNTKLGHYELMPKITLSELQTSGYTEDRESGKVFERRFRWPALFGLLCLVAATYLFFRPFGVFAERSELQILVCGCFALVGTLTLAATTLRAQKAIPVSARSGQPMRRFLQTDADDEYEIYIYVDEPSRTFFCRVVRGPASGAS